VWNHLGLPPLGLGVILNISEWTRKWEREDPQDLEIENQLRTSKISGIKMLTTAWGRLDHYHDGHIMYARMLAQVIRRSPQLYIPESDIKIFVDNNGMIGLTTKDTLPCDSIWGLEGSYPLVIVRKSEEGYKEIAKSTTRHLSPEGKTDDSIFASMLQCHLTFVRILERD
jgi:hypothetical protein